MNKYSLFILLGLTPLLGLAQLFEDATGNSSLLYNNQSFGFFRFNSSASSVRLGYNRGTTDTKNLFFLEDVQYFGGGELEVDLKNQNGKILSISDGFSNGIRFNGKIGLSKENFSRQGEDKKSGKLFKNDYYAAYFIRGGVEFKDYKYLQDSSGLALESPFKLENRSLFNIGAYANYIIITHKPKPGDEKGFFAFRMLGTSIIFF